MYAYVKDLTEGVPDPFTYVHTSRIFQYAAFPSGKNKGQRVNFNPLKHDVNTSYGIVHGREIVKHQVLLVKGKSLLFITSIDTWNIASQVRLRKGIVTCSSSNT